MTEAQAKALLESKAPQIKSYVEDCMAATARKTVNTMGRQGGKLFPSMGRYSIPSDVMIDAPAMNYALFYDKKVGYVNELPSITAMGNEIKDFLSNNADFDSCINNFQPFRGQITVSEGVFSMQDPDFSSNILISFNYPVTISIGKTSLIVDNYEVKIPINMLKIRDIAGRVVNAVQAGTSYTAIMRDQALQQELDVRYGSDPTEKIFIQSAEYNYMNTEISGEMYNTYNTLFTIDYQKQGLDKPFTFNFVTGTE